MWVLDYLVDLESDFSAIHRVDNIYEMEGPRFFQFAARIAAYKSVMQARLAAIEAEETDGRGYASVEQKSVEELQHSTETSDLLQQTVVT